MIKQHTNKTRTKKAIIEAFKELMNTTPFEKITIQGIADLAEISRHTFYNHFDDKYDLLYQIVSQTLIIDNNTSDGKSLIEHSLKQVPQVLHYFQENREFFKSAFNDSKQPSFQDFFKKLLFNWISEIQKCNGRKVDVHKDSFYKTQAGFYVAGYSHLLIQWLYHEPDKPADVLADEIIEIFRNSWSI